MKKTILLISGILVLHFSSFSQTLVTNTLHQNIAKPSISILSNQDDKDVLEDLKSFSKLSGKFTDISKNNYRLERLKLQNMPIDVNSIDVAFENSKRVLKVGFLFLDKNQKALPDNPAFHQFVDDFNKFTQKSLLIKLAENQIKVDQDNLDDANKAISKLEKKIENNLKDQDKLGKKIESNPDLLSKVVAEKESLISDSSTNNAEIQKIANKKDKEISKIQKDQDKATSKLDKKNQEFEDLKTELANAKAFAKEEEKILAASMESLNNLKK